jgi:hypothetical protein
MSGKRGGNDDDTKRAILKGALHIRWTCIRGGNLYSKLPYILQIAIPFFFAIFQHSFQYIQRFEFRKLKAIKIYFQSIEAVSFLFYERNS